ncbi:MAG: phage tail protein I [Chloroflexi bacterium]|nr:phage tail protein I [Chloroflexota bacterium]
MEVGNGAANQLVPSSWVQYLPAPYQADPFLGRFLKIFESVLAPIEGTLDTLPYYFDPHVTPEEFVPWLAYWVAQALDENWPLARRRDLVARAATLHRWRGTRYGLREYIRLFVGHEPLIVENFDGLRLGQDAIMGVTTRLGQRRPHTIAVFVLAERPEEVDEQIVRRIIEAEKPAHVGYVLEVCPSPQLTVDSRQSAGLLSTVDS